MDNINVILLVSRWFHIVAAIVTVGGAAYLRFALLPSAAQTLEEETHKRLREALRARWARVVHASIALLLLTGAINFVILTTPAKIDPMPYHAIFGVKFLTALLLFVIATALVGRSQAFAKVRRRNRAWLNALLVLAGVIVLLSGLLGQIRAAHQASSDRPTPAATSGGPTQ